MKNKDDFIEINLTLEELIDIMSEARRLPEGTFEEFLELCMDLRAT